MEKPADRNRHVKMVCPVCGYIARAAQTWIKTVGPVHCPAHGPMQPELQPDRLTRAALPTVRRSAKARSIPELTDETTNCLRLGLSLLAAIGASSSTEQKK